MHRAVNFTRSVNRRSPQSRRDTTKTQIAVITVCVILIVVIAAGVGGWYLWRMKRKPMRIKQVLTTTKNAIRIDDAAPREVSFMDELPAKPPPPSSTGSVPPSTVPRGIGGVEGWLASTQRSAAIGSQEVPRTPRQLPQGEEKLTPPTPPNITRDLEGSPYERPGSVQSTHQMHSRQSSEQGHGRTNSLNGPQHARPLAFIKNMFGQPGQLEDIQSEGALTPSIAKLPMMTGDQPNPFGTQQDRYGGAPARPMRSDSLVLSQSAYEIYPDASASQYGGRAGRRRDSGDDHVPPMPDRNRASNATGLGRRGSYGAMSSQGGLPLPSFYLPSDPGDSSLPGALPIGESVLASPLENRHPQHGLDVPRRGAPRRPGSNFVVTNATHSDED
ncbi:hypothetical protein BKA62DRAFT_5991 [Auriculariales sp. MPI-PUGE-AT-0066]|nr:hypothetical protein BKA62DRAFT_5991 [Auriculariales sp. MPI-PUGE-AT-0066]